jgi:hypothetical protein
LVVMDSDPANQAIDPCGCGNCRRNAHREMHEYLVFQTSEILALVWPTFLLSNFPSCGHPRANHCISDRGIERLLITGRAAARSRWLNCWL